MNNTVWKRLGLEEQVKSLPGIRVWRARRQYAHFLSADGFASFYGVFEDFAQARAKLPESREFDQRVLAEEHRDVRIHRLYPYDYPVIYWLQVAFLKGAVRVFDIGGSIGVHYHAYHRVLPYPAALSWQVCDLPEIVKFGKEVADQRDSPELTFTDSLDMSSTDVDVLLSAGTLQYIEGGYPHQLLAGCRKHPAHVILNKLPVTDGEEFVVASNIGEGAYAPTQIFSQSRLIGGMEAEGYRLVDLWDVLERDMYIPSHPEKSLEHFTGMYFEAIVAA